MRNSSARAVQLPPRKPAMRRIDRRVTRNRSGAVMILGPPARNWHGAHLAASGIACPMQGRPCRTARRGGPTRAAPPLALQSSGRAAPLDHQGLSWSLDGLDWPGRRHARQKGPPRTASHYLSAALLERTGLTVRPCRLHVIEIDDRPTPRLPFENRGQPIPPGLIAGLRSFKDMVSTGYLWLVPRARLMRSVITSKSWRR